jgi:hypothetical protein
MGVHYDASRRKYVVCWQDDGRRKTRRFDSEPEGVAFAQTVAMRPPGRPASSIPGPAPADNAARVAAHHARTGDGIYAYETRAGTRWRFVYRQSTARRHRGEASRADRLPLPRAGVWWSRSSGGEVKAAREMFGDYWTQLLDARRPYLTAGSFADFETHGRKRLLPTFASVPLARIDEDLVRTWFAAMAAQVEAHEVSAKPINNARTALSVALNDALRRGLILRNPCAAVAPLPVGRNELDYLRLDAIEPYLSACMRHYRPLAEFLVGTGARVSEALAIRFRHIALEDGVVRIYGQRDRDGGGARPTRGKRFRSVQIGPRLIETLGQLQVATTRRPGRLGIPLPDAEPWPLRQTDAGYATEPTDRARLARSSA